MTLGPEGSDLGTWIIKKLKFFAKIDLDTKFHENRIFGSKIKSMRHLI